MSNGQWLTVPQVARRLQVSEESVRRWLRSGRLRGIRPGGNRMGWRIREDEVDNFTEAAARLDDGPGARSDAAEAETPR